MVEIAGWFTEYDGLIPTIHRGHIGLMFVNGLYVGWDWLDYYWNPFD